MKIHFSTAANSHFVVSWKMDELLKYTNCEKSLINGRKFQVAVTKLKMDKDRRDLVDRKAAGRARVTGILKGKHSDETVA